MSHGARVTGARLDGDLIYEKPSFGVSLGVGDPPRVVIGPHAVVIGRLRFGRAVSLYVSEQATVGAIEGATAVRFSGAPPD